jgi:hypothetical protein
MRDVAELVENLPGRKYELVTNLQREARYDLVTLDYLVSALAVKRITGEEQVRYGSELEYCTVEKLLREASIKRTREAEAKQEPLSTAKS